MTQKRENQIKKQELLYMRRDVNIAFWGLTISIISLIISIFSNIETLGLAREANNIEKANMIPTFSIEAIMTDRKQTGYKITNSGGNIQDIGVTLTGILHFRTLPYFTEHYIPYDIYASDYQVSNTYTISVNFSNPTYDLYDAKLGVYNWKIPESNTELITSAHYDICKELKEQNILVNVDYMELLELSYTDASGTHRQNTYFIGKNEDGTLNLIHVSDPANHSVLSNLVHNLYRKRVYEKNGTVTQLYGGFADRSQSFYTTAYKAKVVDHIVTSAKNLQNIGIETIQPDLEAVP